MLHKPNKSKGFLLIHILDCFLHNSSEFDVLGFRHVDAKAAITSVDPVKQVLTYEAPQPLQPVEGWNPLNYDKIGFEAIHVHSPDYSKRDQIKIPTYIILPYNAKIPTRKEFFEMEEVVVRFQNIDKRAIVAGITGRWSQARGVLIFRHDLHSGWYAGLGKG